MPAIALPPDPVHIRAPFNPGSSTEEYAKGREGGLVFKNKQAVYSAWFNLSESLARLEKLPSDELPAVYQPPIVRTVITQFHDSGPHQPLPFPDSDD